MRSTRRLLALASAMLVGALLLSAFVVAPLAFRLLPDDHARAGELAGAIFETIYWVALATGAVIALLGVPRRPRLTLSAVLLIVLGVVEVGFLVPLIAAHGQGWPFSFAALHATAGAVHLALIVVGSGLAWMLSDVPGRDAGLS